MDNPQIPKQGLTRRDLIASSVASVIATASYSYRNELLDQCFQRTATEEQFVNFPATYEGVREIHKFRYRGAEHCLIHFQQIHIKLDAPDRAIQGAKLSQESIRNVLLAFQKDERINFKKLYAEGYAGPGTIGEFQILNELFTLVSRPGGASREDLVKFITLLPNEPQEKVIRLLQNSDTLKLWHAMPGTLSAVHDLEARGIIIAPGEKLLVSPKADKVADEIQLKNLALLEMIVANGDEFAFAVFGAAHDFNTTIKNWNSSHPDHKFCLIEVLCEGTAQAIEKKLL